MLGSFPRALARGTQRSPLVNCQAKHGTDSIQLFSICHWTGGRSARLERLVFHNGAQVCTGKTLPHPQPACWLVP